MYVCIYVYVYIQHICIYGIHTYIYIHTYLYLCQEVWGFCTQPADSYILKFWLKLGSHRVSEIMIQYDKHSIQSNIKSYLICQYWIMISQGIISGMLRQRNQIRQGAGTALSPWFNRGSAMRANWSLGFQLEKRSAMRDGWVSIWRFPEIGVLLDHLF